MTRPDLYGMAHNGVRALLYETAALLQRTDFTRAVEAQRATAAVGRAVAILERHGEHEDAVVMPELKAIAPALFHDLEAEHVRVGGLHREIAALAERLGRGVADEVERRSLGRRLLSAFTSLVAEHLRHMAREEDEAMRVLWAHRTDEELWSIHDRIVARNTPEENAAALALMLPNLCRAERGALLGAIRAHAPAEVFARLTAPAREALGPELWAEAVAASPVPVRPSTPGR